VLLSPPRIRHVESRICELDLFQVHICLLLSNEGARTREELQAIGHWQDRPWQAAAIEAFFEV
jgi:hypothetical protein